MSGAVQRLADASEATGLQLFNQQFIDQLAEAISARILPALKSSARLMTVAETANYIGRTRRAVEHLIERGVIQHIARTQAHIVPAFKNHMIDVRRFMPKPKTENR